MGNVDEQWAGLEAAVRESLGNLPDAEDFTANEVGRIIARVRRVNNDVLDAARQAPEGEEMGPVYSYLIGEIVALCVDVARLKRGTNGED